MATARTFSLVFGNISNIFCSIFQGVSFNYHQKNVRCRVLVSSFQVSVLAFMAKSRSRSFSQVSVSVSEVTVSTKPLLGTFDEDPVPVSSWNFNQISVSKFMVSTTSLILTFKTLENFSSACSNTIWEIRWIILQVFTFQL